VLLLVACAGGGRVSAGSDVFRNPAEFVGQTVRVCGYIHDRFEDQNIWVSRRVIAEPKGPGLGFISGKNSVKPSRWDNRETCVTGRVEKTGCAETMICNWSSFPYALRLLPEKDQKGS
jgi:hypothetical protein